MENGATPAPTKPVRVRREPSIDPVKAQGILTSLTKKERYAAKLWQPTWGFLSKIREVQDEEALKLGFTPEEYKDAVRSVSCHLAPKKYPVVVDPSPFPLPPTSAAMVGRHALCPLERYGRLVKTDCDYPKRPPLKPGQLYDPYKQTLMFLGSVDGDPISYNLPISRYEVTDDMLAQPKQLTITPFDFLNDIDNPQQ